ncbi:MAG: 8-amino-7-oxononanoate synthase [Candidatus Paracaedibacteraceae bacterium]|nr:8-amino-7-oxononanoate synthase [Candidatus Paracaedibacteraceae bacterium]
MVSPFQKALAKKIKAGTKRDLQLCQDYINFTSNDYLALSTHPSVIQAAKAALEKDGAGATGARLLSGNSKALEKLESELAQLKGQEAALIFNSGFQANLTILGTLLSSQYYDKTPIVFSDRLNHASMHQGCQLAGIQQHRYHHLDYDHLQSLIKKHAVPGHPHFILTESVFGMDGDKADLGIICDLAETIDASVYVDEAHATGVYGKNGSGLSSDYANRLFGVMGTFSKALGGFGAYFAGSQELKDFLINFAPGFIYSTALPPATIAANHQAVKLLPSLHHERHHLQALAQQVRSSFSQLGFNTGQSTTHIIPVILGDVEKCTKLHQHLKDAELLTSLIRSPTVPLHTSRLRLALNVKHTTEDIKLLTDIIGNSLIV